MKLPILLISLLAACLLVACSSDSAPQGEATAAQVVAEATQPVGTPGDLGLIPLSSLNLL